MIALRSKALCHDCPTRPRWPVAMFAVLAVLLPPAGALLAGRSVDGCFDFPPMTVPVSVPPFSWMVFAAFMVGLGVVLAPFVRAALRPAVAPVTAPRPGRFPAWGVASVILGVATWVLAWTRFNWFRPCQGYTYIPLWIAFIGTINAWTVRRSGRPLAVRRPLAWLALVAASAAFWWYFEYLNRFAQNWHYVGLGHRPPWKYTLLASLSFATVLPAVLGTAEWLATFPKLGAGCSAMRPLPRLPAGAVALVLAVAVGGLAGVGAWPQTFYPLLWVAPLLILTSLNRLAGGAPFFPELARGDWRRAVRFALAALICGFFWEMWNYLSLAKWIYTVPHLGGMRIFEMPLPGFAGYLPFGLECAVVAAAFGLPVESAETSDVPKGAPR